MLEQALTEIIAAATSVLLYTTGGHLCIGFFTNGIFVDSVAVDPTHYRSWRAENPVRQILNLVP